MGNILGFAQETTYCKNKECISCYGDLEIRGREAYSGGKKIYTFGQGENKEEYDTLKNKRSKIPEKFEKYEKSDTKFYLRKKRNIVPKDNLQQDEIKEEVDDLEETTISYPFVKIGVSKSGDKEKMSVEVPFFGTTNFSKKN